VTSPNHSGATWGIPDNCTHVWHLPHMFGTAIGTTLSAHSFPHDRHFALCAGTYTLRTIGSQHVQHCVLRTSVLHMIGTLSGRALHPFGTAFSARALRSRHGHYTLGMGTTPSARSYTNHDSRAPHFFGTFPQEKLMDVRYKSIYNSSFHV